MVSDGGDGEGKCVVVRYEGIECKGVEGWMPRVVR